VQLGILARTSTFGKDKKHAIQKAVRPGLLKSGFVQNPALKAYEELQLTEGSSLDPSSRRPSQNSISHQSRCHISRAPPRGALRLAPVPGGLRGRFRAAGQFVMAGSGSAAVSGAGTPVAGPTGRDLFAEGLLEFLRPAVQQLDSHVHAVRCRRGKAGGGAFRTCFVGRGHGRRRHDEF
jgi:hypothetical protein